MGARAQSAGGRRPGRAIPGRQGDVPVGLDARSRSRKRLISDIAFPGGATSICWVSHSRSTARASIEASRCTRAASSLTTWAGGIPDSRRLSGFDDAARGKGRVDCRVFADGKEIYANPDLRADAPPVKLALPVADAEQLRLHVDFGRGQDTGDRVIWANARLYRQQAGKVSASRADHTQRTGNGARRLDRR